MYRGVRKEGSYYQCIGYESLRERRPFLELQTRLAPAPIATHSRSLTTARQAVRLVGDGVLGGANLWKKRAVGS